MSIVLIPCMNCGKMLPQNWTWRVCNKCGFRICPHCLSKHQGRYSNGGFKCSRCAYGHMR